MASIRWRLLAAIVAITMSVLMIMDVVVYTSAVAEREGRLRDDALQQAVTAATILASTGAVGPGATLNDAAAPAALRAGIAAGRSGTQIVRANGTTAVWGAVPISNGTEQSPLDMPFGLYVMLSADDEEQALNALRQNLVVASLAILLVAVAVAVAVATGLVRRLVRAAGVAQRIAEGDLDARIGGRGRDEVAVLGRVVDEMAASVQQRIARERRFTADVAHELRTPVTGLVAAADLLRDDDPATAMVRGGSARLAGLVEDLLEISRLESGRETAQWRGVDLRVMIDDLTGRYPRPVSVTGDGSTVTDPRRLERIVANLLDNAFRYGAEPVEITITDREISVRDHGRGFPPDRLDYLTERFVTEGNGGTGLGLAISVEQAKVLGATLTLVNPPGGGARADLRLPLPDLR